MMLIFSASYSQTFNGYALYNELNQNTTYLIDANGSIAHTWSNSVGCNYAVRLKEDGNIVRGGKYSNNQLNGSAVGGMVQEIDPSGNVVWEYVHSTANYVSHHDFEILPNGNVILTAWEVKSTAELTQAGLSNASSEKWPTELIELQPDGNGGATIVWEWHMWDHLVQDIDSGKDNFDVVEDHPELMDINAVVTSSGGGGGPGGGGDWFHVNGLDYNETLDQIVFSSRHASEFFIIDHSTTTAEAASHSGGNSGMGGDFLYRWGNPSNYGSSSAQTIDAAVHDPHWIIDDGRPYGGYIQFFNNEGGSGGGSAVDVIEAPSSGWIYTFGGSSFAPSTYAERHECLANSTGQSASDRMSNGNIFVAVSQQYMYEVDQNGNTVWQYNAAPAKAFRYECDHPGIAVILGANPCGLSIDEVSLANVSVYPNPSNSGVFQIDGLPSTGEIKIQVTNTLGQTVLEVTNTNTIDLSSKPSGMYFVAINNNKFMTLVSKSNQ